MAVPESDLASPRAGRPEPTCGSVKSHQADSIALVGLDPVTRSPGGSARGRRQRVRVSGPTRDAERHNRTARFRSKPQAHVVAAEIAQQAIQRPRRIHDPAVLSYLAAQSARRYRNDDPFITLMASASRLAESAPATESHIR